MNTLASVETDGDVGILNRLPLNGLRALLVILRK